MRGNDVNQRLLFTLTVFLACGICYANRANGATAQQNQARASRTLSSPASFTPDTPFGQAIDILRNAIDPPLPIIVIWKDLDRNADIDRYTPIGMDGVSGVPLRTHLDLLLLAVSADSPTKLGYVVNNGVITVATQDNLPIKRSTRVYDIADIMSRRADSLLLFPLTRARLFMPLLGGLRPF